jgi:group I intron endonuclease
MTVEFTGRSGIYKIQSKIKPYRFYIGSAVNISRRYSAHLWNLKRGTHHSSKMQNHYNKYGKDDFILSVLLYCDKSELITKEQSYIDLYAPFFNECKVAGSNLGIKRTEETKKKMSASRMGIRVSEEHKRKLRDFNKGKKLSEETKRKIGEAGKGRIQTIEKRRKLSIANKGRVLSEETKRKISTIQKGRPAHNKGVHYSAEVRERMSIAHRKENLSPQVIINYSNGQKGRRLSDETKRKIGIKGVGRLHSAESKKKIGEASKMRWLPGGVMRSQKKKERINPC